MTPRPRAHRVARVAVAAGVVVLLTGCAPRPRTLVEAFPPGSVAAPWTLDGAVWSGTLAEAAPGLGPDAAAWEVFRPARVWLAKYRHEDRPGRFLTVRCFAVASPDDAREAVARFRPTGAKPVSFGDEGYWTELGVLFRWGRLVIEVFGPEASWGSEVQSSLLAAYLTKRMPPGLPDNPR